MMEERIHHKRKGVRAMFCPNCNMPRPNDIRFCRQCGAELIHPHTPKKGRIWPPILFMVVMIVVGSVIFASSQPALSQPSPTPWFTVENGVLSFHPELYQGDAQLEIPSTIDGQTVTALADGCFQGCTGLEMVILPDSLERIGGYAFLGCEDLRGIKLTEKVTFIGQEAFYNCPALESIYIPASVQSVGVNAFSACFALDHVFYAGDLDGWMELYPQYINSDTKIYAVSGPDADSYSPL